MRLFGRIFVSHLAAILVACVVLVIAVGIVSPEFYNAHIDRAVHSESAGSPELQVALERGHHRIMLLGLLVSLPFSILLAALTAYLQTRRIVAAVHALVGGSHEIAGGQYRKRLEVPGRDELAELALHFNQMAEALEATETNRIGLIGTVAHELRTPLAALQGYAEALLDGAMPPEGAAVAITREVGVMRRVTGDLLLVARVEAGVIDLRPALHPVGELISDVQDRFSLAFEDRRVALVVDVAEELLQVYADGERVSQVLGNLLSNALRYTPPGGEVVLGARAHDDGVQFRVSDSGPGIPAEYQSRIFERFYRADAARSRGESGIGIGLTVAKGLVEAMGGRIWLESEVERGSSFYFTLPYEMS